MSLRVGIDVDGVLADFNTSYIALIKKHTGIQLPPASPTYPNTWFYDTAAGIEKSRTNACWEDIKQDPAFWYEIPPYEDTEVFLNGLYDLFPAGEFYFITNRMGIEVKDQTEAWLANHGLIFTPTVLITQHKGDAARILNLTHYIDDKNENVADVVKVSPATKTYQLARPWNQKQQGAERVADLATFLEALKGAHESD